MIAATDGQEGRALHMRSENPVHLNAQLQAQIDWLNVFGEARTQAEEETVLSFV